MQLPKGESYKFTSTKNISMSALLDELSSLDFNGYVRLTVERDDNLEDGYLMLKDGVVIGAEFQGEKTLDSKKALDEIKSAWKVEGIVDVYKFSDFQMQISLEENEGTLLSSKTTAQTKKTESKAEKKEEKAPVEDTPAAQPEPVVANAPPISENTPDESALAQDIIDKRSERLALLKKFGMAEPEDDFAEAILSGFKMPSDRELNTTSRELKKDIVKKVKDSSKLDEFDLYISPAVLNDTVEFRIEVYIKPYNKKIEKEVQSTIESTLKEKLTFPYEKGLSINEA